MKQTNDKKQDLLLDALSCIDEDILERSLALRDGTAAPASKAADPAPKTTRPTTVIPPLYDLTRQPDKPPKKNPWRVLAVVAAACLLLCVVPLSMWMVGSMSKNESYGDGLSGTLSGQAGAENGAHTGLFPNFRPDRNPDLDLEDTISEEEVPEVDAPQEPGGTYPPVEEAPDVETTPVYDTERLSWTVTSNQNSNVRYHTWGKNGVEMDLEGAVLTPEALPDASVSPEDQAVLELISQWTFSVMALDYAAHFPLFHERAVEDRFISQIAEYGFSYDRAISRIGESTSALFPIRHLTLNATLTENRLLTGDELESYRQRLTDGVPDPARITAVRRVTFTGMLILNHELVFDLTEEVVGELICYEYDGVLYLDHSLMDDDLSVDLLLSDPSSDKGYFKTNTATCTVTAVAVQNGYLLTEEGNVFLTDNAEVYAQTDNGKWERVSALDIPAEGIVTITYYSFSIEGLTVLGSDGPLTLACAQTIRIGG